MSLIATSLLKFCMRYQLYLYDFMSPSLEQLCWCRELAGSTIFDEYCEVLFNFQKSTTMSRKNAFLVVAHFHKADVPFRHLRTLSLLTRILFATPLVTQLHSLRNDISPKPGIVVNSVTCHSIPMPIHREETTMWRTQTSQNCWHSKNKVGKGLSAQHLGLSPEHALNLDANCN